MIASSVALVGFGADSMIEADAGVIVLWLMAGQRSASQTAERRAQQLIAASFVLLTIYVVVQAGRDLVGDHPGASWMGIGLAAITVVTMPPLAAAKRRLGRTLGSSATTSESRQTMLCAYLSAGLLVGLVANAAAGRWGPTQPWRSASERSRCARLARPGAGAAATAASAASPFPSRKRPGLLSTQIENLRSLRDEPRHTVHVPADAGAHDLRSRNRNVGGGNRAANARDRDHGLVNRCGARRPSSTDAVIRDTG